MCWCYKPDEDSAKNELLDRSKYPSGYALIWVCDTSKDIGYQKALKKYEEVFYAKSTSGAV